MLSACAVQQPPADHASRFQTEIYRVRIQFGFPGITAAYVLGYGTVGTAASGLADVEAEVPMSGNARILSASIGKSLVGSLCIALALEGRLALDEPVSQWLGTFDWQFLFPLALLDTSSADHRDLDRLAAGYKRPDNLLRFPVKALDADGHLYWHRGFLGLHSFAEN